MKDYIAINKENGMSIIITDVVRMTMVEDTTSMTIERLDEEGRVVLGNVLDLLVWDLHSEDTEFLDAECENCDFEGYDDYADDEVCRAKTCQYEEREAENEEKVINIGAKLWDDIAKALAN